jgi:tetratricopeptide (TPR) repeat protein
MFILGMIALSVALPLRSVANAGAAEECNDVRNPDRQVRGCSAYIKNAAGGPESLAIAHLNRANVRARRGRFDSAFADYGAALRLDPKNPLILYNRGNAYFDIKRYDQAIADYTQAIALDQKFALAYYNRGLAEERLGDAAAAAEDYRRVLTLEPTAATARQHLERLQTQ